MSSNAAAGGGAQLGKQLVAFLDLFWYNKIECCDDEKY